MILNRDCQGFLCDLEVTLPLCWHLERDRERPGPLFLEGSSSIPQLFQDGERPLPAMLCIPARCPGLTGTDIRGPALRSALSFKEAHPVSVGSRVPSLSPFRPAAHCWTPGFAKTPLTVLCIFDRQLALLAQEQLPLQCLPCALGKGAPHKEQKPPDRRHGWSPGCHSPGPGSCSGAAAKP